MMKVVKGNPKWKQVFKCPECSAELEVTEDDLWIKHTHDNGVRLVFKCMACHSDVDVTTEVPTGMQQDHIGYVVSKTSADES